MVNLWVGGFFKFQFKRKKGVACSRGGRIQKLIYQPGAARSLIDFLLGGYRIFFRTMPFTSLGLNSFEFIEWKAIFKDSKTQPYSPRNPDTAKLIFSVFGPNLFYVSSLASFETKFDCPTLLTFINECHGMSSANESAGKICHKKIEFCIVFVLKGY